MKKINRYDHWVEELQNILGRKNGHLFQESATGQEILKLILNRQAELSSAKDLFLRFYIPGANKAIAEENNEIQKSKYKKLISISMSDLQETRFETIRMGYTMLFHKYENFIDDLIRCGNLLVKDIHDKAEISAFAKAKFNYNIKDWKNSKYISKINWINNCCKHYDGFPRKLPVPENMVYHPDEIRLRFTSEQLKHDFEIMAYEYTKMIQIVFVIASYMIVNFDISEEQLHEDPQIKAHESEMMQTINKLIELHK